MHLKCSDPLITPLRNAATPVGEVLELYTVVTWLCSACVGKSRMAAPGSAISAALRRSQDLDIGEQKHRHADRSARSSHAHRFFTSLHPTSNKSLFLEKWTLVRFRATVFVGFFSFFFNGSYSARGTFSDLRPLLHLWEGRFYLQVACPVQLQLVMFLVRKGVAHA